MCDDRSFDVWRELDPLGNTLRLDRRGFPPRGNTRVVIWKFGIALLRSPLLCKSVALQPREMKTALLVQRVGRQCAFYSGSTRQQTYSGSNLTGSCICLATEM